jgi:hypothetical protein
MFTLPRGPSPASSARRVVRSPIRPGQRGSRVAAFIVPTFGLFVVACTAAETEREFGDGGGSVSQSDSDIQSDSGGDALSENPACLEAVASLQEIVKDVVANGGACATLADCTSATPRITCNGGVRYDTCPLGLSNEMKQQMNSRLVDVEAKFCSSACRSLLIVTCRQTSIACESGRCTTVAL